jgi:hypothetical protein
MLEGWISGLQPSLSHVPTGANLGSTSSTLAHNS